MKEADANEKISAQRGLFKLPSYHSVTLRYLQSQSFDIQIQNLSISFTLMAYKHPSKKYFPWQVMLFLREREAYLRRNDVSNDLMYHVHCSDEQTMPS